MSLSPSPSSSNYTYHNITNTPPSATIIAKFYPLFSALKITRQRNVRSYRNRNEFEDMYSSNTYTRYVIKQKKKRKISFKAVNYTERSPPINPNPRPYIRVTRIITLTLRPVTWEAETGVEVIPC